MTLHRAARFSILAVETQDGIQMELKIANHLLHAFHTDHQSMILAWTEGGKLRFGCQLPTHSSEEDLFLTQDKSKTPRSALDSSYRPLQEFFEPWAQQYASVEQTAGFGLVSQQDELTEPWMEGRFRTSTDVSPPVHADVRETMIDGRSTHDLQPKGSALEFIQMFESDELSEPRIEGKLDTYEG